MSALACLPEQEGQISGVLVRKGIGWDLLPTPSLACFIFFFCSLSILSQPHAVPNVWVGYSNA
jgi:hypothetical protein